jgi:ABC-2 type transport system ATP-binding protein
VTSDASDVLQVRGLTAEQIGLAAWQARLPVFELTTQRASLEEAFMQLTDDSVDFRSHDARGSYDAHDDAHNGAETAVAR